VAEGPTGREMGAARREMGKRNLIVRLRAEERNMRSM
jgi:hypothetical protein